MELNFLPNRIKKEIIKLKNELLYEIRLRKNFPVTVNYEGKRITIFNLICKSEDIDEILLNVTKRSLYAYNEQIKQGFINYSNGIRIGIAGECVFEGDKIVTIKSISSLNIRIPHLVKDCSKIIRDKIFNGQDIISSLIVSPPSRGKTTFLKDLALYLNESSNHSILIVDERGEFNEVVGKNIDKISFSNKQFAFEYAIRSMSPDVIITDELVTKSDWDCVFRAKLSGVGVIASSHGGAIDDVLMKDYYIPNVFSNIFLLNKKGEFGVVEERTL